MTSDRFNIGFDLMDKILPGTGEQLLALPSHLEDLGRLAIEYGYGEIMTSPILDIKTREMLNITILGVMGLDVQLEAHIKGALNVGVSKNEIGQIILQLAGFAGFPAAFNVAMIAMKIYKEMDNETTDNKMD